MFRSTLVGAFMPQMRSYITDEPAYMLRQLAFMSYRMSMSVLMKCPLNT